MRRLLLALTLCIPLYAHAQQAANPVEPFSYGVRTGTPQNPIVAALSSVVPSAQAGSTQAAAPVELFSYGRRVGTQSNPLSIYCPTCSGGGGGSYTLPPATTSTLGGMIAGAGLNVAADGTVSVAPPSLVNMTGGGNITAAMNGAVVGDLQYVATSWQYYILPASAPVGFTVHIFQGAKDASVQTSAHANVSGGSDLASGQRGLTVVNVGTEAAPVWATY